ncbi:hypothetical protein EI555_000071, partial [Monodon monoceros]
GLEPAGRHPGGGSTRRSLTHILGPVRGAALVAPAPGPGSGGPGPCIYFQSRPGAAGEGPVMNDTRAARVKELLVDCYKPTEAFSSGQLSKIWGMQKLSTPQK